MVTAVFVGVFNATVAIPFVKATPSTCGVIGWADSLSVIWLIWGVSGSVAFNVPGSAGNAGCEPTN